MTRIVGATGSDGFLTMADAKAPFLTPEHRRQTIVVSVVASIPSILALIVFLGVVWADHTTLAALYPQVGVIESKVNDLDHRLTVRETRGIETDHAIAQLTDQTEKLRSSVTDLTVVAQKLTDFIAQDHRK